MLIEPLDPVAAKARILEILGRGRVTFSRHLLRELEKDDLTTVDVAGVLRGGTVDPAELEQGSWRYPVRTQRVEVVVVFRSEEEVVVVTAWRR